MSFSIYNLDDEIKELLNLDNFLKGLTVNEFIEELSKDHFLKGAEVNKLEYLDPKPYIRTFESTLRELKQLSQEAETTKDMLEKQVNDYEVKHSRNVLELSDKVEEITKQFTTLDSRISDVSEQIDPLNTALNKITNSRDVSKETIFLIRAYHGFFTKQKYDPLEDLRTSKKYEDKLNCAKTVNNLLSLAKKIESPEIGRTSQCVKDIQKFSELMERALLSKFEVALENDEFEIMKEIADILDEYNDGVSVIQTFVNKNDILEEISNGNMSKSMLDDETIWTRISNPNDNIEIRDENLEDTLNHLKVTIKGHARIVSQVFKDSTPVLKILIQRVYAQLIRIRTEGTLQYSLSVNNLAYVRVLQYVYQLTGDFTSDLKEFFVTNDFDNDGELASNLDQCNYDLFLDFISGNTYFGKERKQLEDLVFGIVAKFTSYNERPLTTKPLTAVLDSMDLMDSNEQNQANNDRFGFKFTESKRLNQFKEFMKTHLTDRNNRSSVEVEDAAEKQQFSTMNLSIVETVIKSIIESMARVLELEPNRTSECATEILEILLFDFGRMYVLGGLEIIYDQLKTERNYTKVNSVSQIDFSYLTSFNLLTDILYLISSCIKKVLIPCTVNNPGGRSRIVGLTNDYIKRCENSIKIILNETIDLINDKTVFLLSKQKKKDFVVDSITEFDTEACELVSEFMNKTHENLGKSLNNANLLNVLTRVGTKFLNLLLEHYKKFPVNSTGGIILTKDVIRLQTVIDTWEISQLSENFQILKEISNLFTVHPNLINSLITEGQLATLKPFTIRQYISKRTDFNPSYLERFFSFK